MQPRRSQAIICLVGLLALVGWGAFYLSVRSSEHHRIAWVRAHPNSRETILESTIDESDWLPIALLIVVPLVYYRVKMPRWLHAGEVGPGTQLSRVGFALAAGIPLSILFSIPPLFGIAALVVAVGLLIRSIQRAVTWLRKR